MYAEAKGENATMKQQVRGIENKFRNTIEINVQEVVYIILYIPIKKDK